MITHQMWPTIRGNAKEPLGGMAGSSGSSLGYILCGDCSPEPLEESTAIFMKVRKVGLVLPRSDGSKIGVDVVECPKCHRQILR
jgi:hypothetical protein